MSISLSQIFKASQLTKGGRLMEATRLIQQTLGIGKSAAAARNQPRSDAEAGVPDSNDVSDVPFRETFRESSPRSANEPAFRQPLLKMPAAAEPTPSAFREQPELDDPMVAPPAPRAPAARPRPASFEDGSFRMGDTAHVYRLYVPSLTATEVAEATLLPLIVLLHGCKQNAEDFALGTAMNALAEQDKCLVLYPEQSSQANMMRCWNWFDAAHQARDAGEPKLIAALTRNVIENHHADPSRVYVAGLSAGGAMAAVVAGLYPEVFAAVGVHSGLPAGAASDMMSAFSAMRNGAKESATGAANGALEKGSAVVMPTIVFHGSADQTVNPGNGEHIIDAAIAALRDAGIPLKKVAQTEASLGTKTGRRETLRTIYSAADGVPYVEYWAVGSGPHAWSGGDAAGSFTDPHGPSASRAMLDFFLKHRR